MIKKILSIAIVLTLVLVVLTADISADVNTVTLNDNSVIQNNNSVIQNNNTGIPDRVLYRAILRELGKNENEKFTKAEAASIKVLSETNHLNKNKIKTLKGIENLTGLTILSVTYNEITSLVGIDKLTDLISLDAGCNKLTNLIPIRNLTKLKSLDIGNNKSTDLSPIKNLTKLTFLSVSGNKITSLAAVKNLTALESLSAGNCKSKVLPNLTKHTKLKPKYTGFGYNNIKKKEFKSKLPSQLLDDYGWFITEIKFQNVKRIIKITKPKSFKKITKKL